MTGKGKLLGGSENSQATQSLRRLFFGHLRIEHENGFRKVHLPRNPEHLILSDTLTLGKNGERVTGKGLLGKHVELNETMTWHKSPLLKAIFRGAEALVKSRC